jgi:hypothetical protein
MPSNYLQGILAVRNLIHMYQPVVLFSKIYALRKQLAQNNSCKNN